MFFSPLEQFEVNSLFNFTLTNNLNGDTNILLLFTNINVFMLLILLLGVTCYRYIQFYGSFIPTTAFQSFLELLIGFIEGLVKENVASKNKIFQVFTPYIFCIFLFILASNYVGMVPYSFTITSSLAVTFSMSLATFIGINIIGSQIHKFAFLALFLPPGCPFKRKCNFFPTQLFQALSGL